MDLGRTQHALDIDAWEIQKKQDLIYLHSLFTSLLSLSNTNTVLQNTFLRTLEEQTQDNPKLQRRLVPLSTRLSTLSDVYYGLNLPLPLQPYRLHQYQNKVTLTWKTISRLYAATSIAPIEKLVLVKESSMWCVKRYSIIQLSRIQIYQKRGIKKFIIKVLETGIEKVVLKLMFKKEEKDRLAKSETPVETPIPVASVESNTRIITTLSIIKTPLIVSKASLLHELLLVDSDDWKHKSGHLAKMHNIPSSMAYVALVESLGNEKRASEFCITFAMPLKTLYSRAKQKYGKCPNPVRSVQLWNTAEFNPLYHA